MIICFWSCAFVLCRNNARTQLPTKKNTHTHTNKNCSRIIQRSQNARARTFGACSRLIKIDDDMTHTHGPVLCWGVFECVSVCVCVVFLFGITFGSVCVFLIVGLFGGFDVVCAASKYIKYCSLARDRRLPIACKSASKLCTN